MEPRRARDFWQLFEPVHALVYFAPECVNGMKEIGLKGFWMGYFAGRAAPMGAVGPAVVDATFYMFGPSMVHRAIPDAWGFASADTVLEARRANAALALRRLCRGVDDDAAALVALIAPHVERAGGGGRTLFSANRELGVPEDPVEGLWQLATCLREHRFDGHVAALVTHGLSGLEATLLFARAQGLDDELFSANRGWSGAQWQEAIDALEARGLLDGERPSDVGRSLREEVEAITDQLAADLFAHASSNLDAIEAGLARVASAITRAGAIPYPNPIGLPAPSPVPRSMTDPWRAASTGTSASE
ncbi:MAG: SCO6745 family protein [Acidimicrobiales bacterium]